MTDNVFRNKDIIILDDNKEYVIVSQADIDEHKYLYLCEINNVDNIKFVELEENNQLSIINSDEVELIKKLIFLFINNVNV